MYKRNLQFYIQIFCYALIYFFPLLFSINTPTIIFWHNSWYHHTYIYFYCIRILKRKIYSFYSIQTFFLTLRRLVLKCGLYIMWDVFQQTCYKFYWVLYRIANIYFLLTFPFFCCGKHTIYFMLSVLIRRHCLNLILFFWTFIFFKRNFKGYAIW